MNEVAGGGGEGVFGACGDGVDADAVGKGELFEFGDEDGDALGKIVGELAEVAQDGGEADGEEDGQDGDYCRR